MAGCLHIAKYYLYCNRHLKPSIVILFYLLVSGCLSRKIPLQDFIDDNTDSLFLTGYVRTNITGYVDCLGYHSDGHEKLNESLREV